MFLVLCFQAIVLGFIAEYSLPMALAPVFVNTARALAKDKQALDMLSMDRTTDSYKLTYGLGASFHEKNCYRNETESILFKYR